MMIAICYTFAGIILVFYCGFSNAAPSLHPDIWNHDGIKGGSLLELHHDYDDHGKIHQSIHQDKLTRNSRRGGSNSDDHQDQRKVYQVETDDVNIEPAYENTVNPFLSHIEQAWKLKPVRHRYMKKKSWQGSAVSPQQQLKMTPMNTYADELFGPLPVDPDKPHFMDSNEAADAEAEENRAFGNEEKDLGNLLRVLFSPDY